MANSFDYQFNVGGNFTAAMEGMAESTGRFSAAVETSTQGLSKWEQKFSAFGLITDYATRLSDMFNGITQAGASAELQLMNLKTLFGGNAEAAEEMYGRISEYGKVTPYDKAGLLEAQRTMMSFGLSGEAAFETLRQIGDIAMGDSQKMQSLALAFAQMSSTGRLTGQDLMQMVNAGFNPLNEISKQTGKSVGELKEEMSRGAISADMVAAAFRSATSEGGLFHGAIEAASETTAGKMASMQDSIEEMKVSIFQATGDLGLWMSAAGQAAVPIAQLLPLIQGLGAAMQTVRNLQWASMWQSVATNVRGAMVGLLMYNQTMAAGIVVSGGFRANMLQATWAVLRFATVGILSALKGVGALVLSLVTGGTTSAAFAATASASFGAFKLSAVTACRAVGVAIMNIPVIGWVIAAIAGLVALGAYFWKTSATFRAVIKGLWASFKAFFSGLIDLAVGIFSSVADLIKACFNFDGEGITNALGKLGTAYADYGANIGKAFSEAYNEEMEASRREEEAKKKAEQQDDPLQQLQQIQLQQQQQAAANTDPTGGTLQTVGKGAAPTGSGDRIRTVTVNIDRLVERFEIHTTNLQNDVHRVKEMVSEALLSALNDVNLAAG